ncbi:MAG: lysylphosphatidylglycerol synthase transmembrane domain-containing protein [Candidatus Eisenbacteria bacterium]
MRARSLAIGMLISAVFLYLAFRKTDLHEVWSHLASARYGYLLPASLLTLAAFWIRALRWGWLLHPVKRISNGKLYSATMIGFMCNNILPMRLGELVRAYVIGRSAQIRPSAAFATIVVERLFDLFSMIGVFGLILLFFPFDNRTFKIGAMTAFGVGLTVLVLLIIFQLRSEQFTRCVRPVIPCAIRERVLRALDSFQTGLMILRDPGRLAVIGGLTLIMWFLIVIVIRLCFAAARLEEGGASLAPLSSLIVLVVMAIGVMVPSGPGFVGTLQAAAVLGLAIAGYRYQSRALGFSILYHATQWFPVVLVGFLYLMKEQLSLAQVGRMSDKRVLADDPREDE